MSGSAGWPSAGAGPSCSSRELISARRGRKATAVDSRLRDSSSSFSRISTSLASFSALASTRFSNSSVCLAISSMACRWLAQSGRCDAIVMLGAIVRGGTDHYDYICSGVTDGAMRVQLDFGIPIGFGVLTCATMELALARAGGDAGNKGIDAAMAALAMGQLKQQIGVPGAG